GEAGDDVVHPSPHPAALSAGRGRRQRPFLCPLAAARRACRVTRASPQRHRVSARDRTRADECDRSAGDGNRHQRPDPAPILRWREGDTLTLAVTNRLSEPSSIHWHGIRTPAPMDGVPGLSFPGIPPGETFVYRFPVRQSGTYWYHSHSGFQEQTGVYAPIVILPKGGYAQGFDRDYVVMLSGWTKVPTPSSATSNFRATITITANARLAHSSRMPSPRAAPNGSPTASNGAGCG